MTKHITYVAFAPLLTLVVLLSSIAFDFVPHRLAEAKCNPQRSNDYVSYRWVGSRRAATGIGGVYASILNYSPWVYYISSTQSSVSSWTMLNNSTGDRWAQVGWLEFPSGVRYTVVQYTRYNGGSWVTWSQLYAPQTTGTSAYYTVLYNYPQPGNYSFQVAGSTIKTATDAPFSPGEAHAAAETQSLADQMPGGSSAGYHEQFYDTEIWLGSWQAFAGTGLNSDSSRFTLNGLSTYNFETWDDACTS